MRTVFTNCRKHGLTPSIELCPKCLEQDANLQKVAYGALKEATELCARMTEALMKISKCGHDAVCASEAGGPLCNCHVSYAIAALKGERCETTIPQIVKN